MTPRSAFAKDSLKFKTHELAERLGGMTVAELRRRMPMHELIDWVGYDRYRAALEDQARERAKMQSGAKGKPRGRR